MKGVIFILLEKVVSEAHGDGVWEALLEKSGASGTYTSLGSYPDEELLGLVAAASEATGRPQGEILTWFGRKAMPLLRERYPDFFARHRQTIPFILTLNEIIHPEVRKLYPGAEAPDVGFRRSGPDELEREYRSKKKMCALAEGLIQGAADIFGETVTITQPRCMHRGDESCLMTCRFTAKAA